MAGTAALLHAVQLLRFTLHTQVPDHADVIDLLHVHSGPLHTLISLQGHFRQGEAGIGHHPHFNNVGPRALDSLILPVESWVRGGHRDGLPISCDEGDLQG